MNEETTALTTPEEETQLAPPAGAALTMWNDSKLLASAYKAAKFLASSDIVPEQTYKGKPSNCLIALDMANRMNISPLMVMQNLHIVKGKPGWSGSFCVAAINGCGKFSPLKFVNDGGGGVYAKATRLSDGELCKGATITMQMAKDEGWLQKTGSKWKTMPEQMLMYRAASFFARAFCPEVLMGIQTIEEVQDVSGYEPEAPQTVHVSLTTVAATGSDQNIQEGEYQDA